MAMRCEPTFGVGATTACSAVNKMVVAKTDHERCDERAIVKGTRRSQAAKLRFVLTTAWFVRPTTSVLL